MLDQKQFVLAVNQIAAEKGISREKIMEIIEMSIATAYKKDSGRKGQVIKAKFNPETGEVKISQIKLVVDKSMLKKEEEEEPSFAKASEDEEEKKIRFNPDRHILLDEAKKINSKIQAGEEMIFSLEGEADYGRIAAQTAKQVLIQALREAERSNIYEEFKNKENQIISAIVQRVEGKTVYFDLGKTTGVMFQQEQVMGEYYRLNQRMKVYVLSVEQTAKGPLILLSRSHPKLLLGLFALEVPEIASSAVEVKAVTREAGARSKIAVISNQAGIDPIGSLVGQKGTRVSVVISELGGEKIDIIQWDEDPAKFVANALSPAKVVDVELKIKGHDAKVLVPDDQLSLAIGKGGQNVRLAAKLTGWKIDVRSVGKPEEKIQGGIAEARPEVL